MPGKIDNVMFSPCGVNCMVCYVHLKKKKPCKGCLFDDLDKPERCKSCEIKNCAKEKGLIYCFECTDFPCKRIVYLDKSYQKRYKVSLIENSKETHSQGFEYFFNKERKKLACSKCGGIISLHDKDCSECGNMIHSGKKE